MVASGRSGSAGGSGSRSSCLPLGTACSRFYGAAGWADPRGPPASPPLVWSPALLPAHPRPYSASPHTGANLFLSQTISFPQPGGSELSRTVPTCCEAGPPPSPNPSLRDAPLPGLSRSQAQHRLSGDDELLCRGHSWQLPTHAVVQVGAQAEDAWRCCSGARIRGHKDHGTMSPEHNSPRAWGITYAIHKPGWLWGSSGSAPLRGTWRLVMRAPPAPTRPGSSLRLGVPPVPGAPCCPHGRRAPPGMGINRKPCAPAVPRDRPGMRRWPPDCLFGVKAAGSCREEPGSTRPGIARELIATSRKDLQHLWVCRDAQPWVPLAGDSHPSPLPWPGSGQCPEASAAR